jgi:alpha-glucosidase
MRDRPDEADITPTVSVSRRAAVKGLVYATTAAVVPWSTASADAMPPKASADQRLFTMRNGSYTAGRFLIDVSQRQIRVRHQGDPARSLWESVPDKPFLQVARGNAIIREHGNPLGSFDVKDTLSHVSTFQSIRSVVTPDAHTLIVRGSLSDSQWIVGFQIAFRALSENQLQFAISTEGHGAEPFNRIFLRYSSSTTEAFFGFGQQLTYFNQKGNVIPILVQEHGIGRGLPVVTQLVDLKYDGAGGTPYLTEAPAPHYITSHLRSVFLENHEYSVFDMRDPECVAVTLFSPAMTGRILFGHTPLDLIEEYSAYAGRMRALPAWIHEGAMVAAQGGTAMVNALLTTLLDANVPICGLWIQDWSGTKTTDAGQQVLWNWQLSLDHYPKWDELVERLAQRNARVLIYINPFLVPGPLYDEAESKGYLVKRGGTTFTYTNSSIRAGMFDLSNPGTRAWVKELIINNLIGIKASGWMADFGEALPFDAELYDGADPQVWHNHYPEAWALVHREAIEETGRGSDFVLWNRSGFTRSPGISTSFWLGDQLQTWDEYDGIKTAVVGLLSGGISGFSLLHSDTGGFVAAKISGFPVIARSKELLMRWMELNAFTTIFRTHEGLVPSISAQVDTDAETLSHFARFAQIYRALASYRKALVGQAAAIGYPVVRHLFLHYPNDSNVYNLRYQFMLGSDFLIAPVLDKGAEAIRLYLPAGNWTHLWTQRTFAEQNGQWITVAAPLGQPGVFFKTGSKPGEQLVATLQASAIL